MPELGPDVEAVSVSPWKMKVALRVLEAAVGPLRGAIFIVVDREGHPGVMSLMRGPGGVGELPPEVVVATMRRVADGLVSPPDDTLA